ncbi:fluoride efflux transporter CrcB [uncultured Brevundimonas sp.]|uniref:fluoride efflux transporter CrcB n=1 Tax=uncultured Brevundimonas sp. TaxID=213418 RepID=UPI0025E50754|nr:fluoride efflux transporter CrcB [uncultured Brevundimonas sp.]
MTRFLLVALGGGLGATARYGLGLAAGRLAPQAAWPLGTFAVNLIGGLLMGLLAGWLALRGGAQAEAIRLFAAVGVLGGFTTFSAFSLETALLIERRELALAAGYVVASVVLAVGALFAGLFFARRVFA